MLTFHRNKSTTTLISAKARQPNFLKLHYPKVALTNIYVSNPPPNPNLCKTTGFISPEIYTKYDENVRNELHTYLELNTHMKTVIFAVYCNNEIYTFSVILTNF